MGSRDHTGPFLQQNKRTGCQWETYLAVVILFPLVSLDGADDVAGILNHHLTCINVSLTEKTPAMDGRPGTKMEKRSDTNFASKVKCMNT